MIIETIVTTLNEDGTTNIAPMGPHIESGFKQFELKPFKTSTTYQNLVRSKQGVLHITDDAMLFARAAIGKHSDHLPDMVSAEIVQGSVIKKVVRWFEFKVDFIEDTADRSTIKCHSVKAGTGIGWRGFNRARHAVLEAAILATRVAFLPAGEIAEQFRRLAVIVEKTGGIDERSAFELLNSYVEEFSASKS